MKPNSTIGFALTGSFCTLREALLEMEKLKAAGARVVPILSGAVALMDTRFGSAAYWREEIKRITELEPIDTIAGAEPIGPGRLLDALVICPCTGNTLAKIANAVTDTPVTMAAKAQLRNRRPVVLAVSTNDGLSANAKNIGALLNVRHVYFVPFGQDDPFKKQNSLIADFTMLKKTVELALEGEQIEPLLR